MELDLNSTKDGQVIIFHDEDLGRVCGEEYAGKLPIEYDYADLPKHQREYKWNDVASEIFYKLRDDEDGQITLLEDLFAWAQPMKKLGFSIDAKTATEELAEKFNRLVIKYDMERRVVWGSGFASDPHELVINKNENVTRFMSLTDVIQVYVLWLCGCVFCCPLPGDFFVTTTLTRESIRKGSGCFGCILAML